MRNCTNYATNTKANGILGETSGISMFNCENYGDIYYSSAFIGGASGKIILKNCNNFGKLYSNKGIQGFYITTFASGGVSVLIENCKNDSAFIGRVYGWSGVIGYTGIDSWNISISVKNFHHKVDYSQATDWEIFMFLYSLTGNKSLVIENSVFEPINSTRSTFVVANTYKGASVEMKNIEIRGSAKTFRLMHSPQYARVKNVLMNLDKNTNDDNNDVSNNVVPEEQIETPVIECNHNYEFTNISIAEDRRPRSRCCQGWFLLMAVRKTLSHTSLPVSHCLLAI